jgi:hypothetical protein
MNPTGLHALLRGVRFESEHHLGPHGWFRSPPAHLQVEVVPADDCVLDQAIAGLGDLLVFLEGEYEVARAADCHSSGKPVGKFDFVKQCLDGHAQFDIVDITAGTNQLAFWYA